ncbi:hypothetical protein GBA52_010438 [Prunus armeniaca]|nr:hypothetical protein GBA52_010438 [Prunus armeniaca]
MATTIVRLDCVSPRESLAVAITLVVVVGMWCSSLLCGDQRTMFGHRRFSLSGSELKWSASQESFYCFLCGDTGLCLSSGEL